MNKQKLLMGSAVTIAVALFAGCSQQAAPTVAADQMLKDGVKKLMTVTSNQFEAVMNGDLTDGSVTIDPAQPDANKSTVALNFSGSVDIKNVEDPKLNLKVDGNVVSGPQTGLVSAEVRFDKSALYFILSKLDSKGGEPIPQELITQFVNKWWKIALPPEALKGLTDSLPVNADDSKLTPEQKQLRDLMVSTSFFKDVTYVGTDSVKGETSYHSNGTLDKAAFKDFVTKVGTIEKKPISADDLKDLDASLAKFELKGDFWIGKDSGMLNQISVNLTVKDEESKMNGTFTAKSTFWDFNKPVTIEVPKDATDFPISSLLQGFMGGDDSMMLGQ